MQTTDYRYIIHHTQCVHCLPQWKWDEIERVCMRQWIKRTGSQRERIANVAATATGWVNWHRYIRIEIVRYKLEQNVWHNTGFQAIYFTRHNLSFLLCCLPSPLRTQHSFMTWGHRHCWLLRLIYFLFRINCRLSFWFLRVSFGVWPVINHSTLQSTQGKIALNSQMEWADFASCCCCCCCWYWWRYCVAVLCVSCLPKLNWVGLQIERGIPSIETKKAHSKRCNAHKSIRFGKIHECSRRKKSARFMCDAQLKSN